MPMVYIKNELYDNIIRNNKNPAKYVNDILEDAQDKEIEAKDNDERFEDALTKKD